MIFNIYSPDFSLQNSSDLSLKEKNFHLTRTALKNCLRQFAPQRRWDNMEQLKIINHHFLQQDGELRVSLSHTKEVGAALLCHCNEAESVGIDIEYSHRPISYRAVNYFKNPKDKWNYQSKENILWAWSIKEAAFKALSPLLEKNMKKPLLLKHIWIEEPYFGVAFHENPMGKFQKKYDKKLFLNIALAFTGKTFENGYSYAAWER
ncbi:MAG: 4'-phosphopantetheinyl transferase superfamily protein [Halobacteriovoraceae bacterium]|nr:4'-phosphopantetheinyl transferase superfamily protein [Halobacteriovoraceae bacterium]